MKCAWQYLCDNCDHAGLWDADFELVTEYVGDTVTAEECESHFTRKRLHKISEDKYFLPGFLTFQYGRTLFIKNNTHLSALKILEKYELVMLVRGPWEIDRTPKGQKDHIPPEPITDNREQVQALINSFMKRIPA